VAGKTNNINTLRDSDSPIHCWYRFVLAYPPHLVTTYLERFGVAPGMTVLDPFCGTGTTLVECKKRGVHSIGVEAHPMPLLASRVKTTWDIDLEEAKRRSESIVRAARVLQEEHGLESLSLNDRLYVIERLGPTRRALNGLALTDDETKLIPDGFLSPRPLKRLLILRHVLERRLSKAPALRDFFLLALAKTAVSGAGNFAFGPEIYRTKPKKDFDVLGAFSREVFFMIQDLEQVRLAWPGPGSAHVLHGDARDLPQLPSVSDAVITSPPYPNEKDYTRTTRVESVLLGLVTSRSELREVKESLLRSNTRNVFVDDTDSQEVADFPKIQRVCRAIERRREELGKTSGFERLYHKVVSHYFGGMRRHFRSLFPNLRPGAKCAYVVGDQLSFLMVPVRTAQLLADVASAEGFRVTGIDLWRERYGTKIRNAPRRMSSMRIREEVLVLERS
jgi:DNA modification methylase